MNTEHEINNQQQVNDEYACEKYDEYAGDSW